MSPLCSTKVAKLDSVILPCYNSRIGKETRQAQVIRAYAIPIETPSKLGDGKTASAGPFIGTSPLASVFSGHLLAGVAVCV